MTIVQVQAVLYQHRTDVIDTFVDGVLESGRAALDSGAVSAVRVVLGDCSQPSCLADTQAAALARRAAECGTELTVRAFDTNLGHGAGQNALAEAARSDVDVLVLLNPDGRPAVGLLPRLVEALTRPDIGAAEARQSPFEHPKYYDTRTGETAWVTGAAVALRRAAFDSVGGFDESFFLHGDDVDLSWRLRLAGWRLVHVPEAVHVHDKTLAPDGSLVAPPTEHRYGTDGMLRLLHKYSRPEAAEHWVRHVYEHGDEYQLQAVEQFVRERDAGRLPAPIDPDHRVSEVIGDQLGRYRY